MPFDTTVISPGLTGIVGNVVVAVLILIVGWILAALLASFTRGLLQRTGLDERLRRTLGGTATAPQIARGVASAVFFVVMVLAVVAALRGAAADGGHRAPQRLPHRRPGVPAPGGRGPPPAAPGVAPGHRPAGGRGPRPGRRAPGRAPGRSGGCGRALGRGAAGAGGRHGDSGHGAGRRPRQGAPARRRSGARPRRPAPCRRPSTGWCSCCSCPASSAPSAWRGCWLPLLVMLNQLLGFLPNLLAAGLILVVGWFAVRLIQRIVTGLLAGLGVDALSDRVGLGPPWATSASASCWGRSSTSCS